MLVAASLRPPYDAGWRPTLTATESGVSANPRNSSHLAGSYWNLDGHGTLLHGGMLASAPGGVGSGPHRAVRHGTAHGPPPTAGRAELGRAGPPKQSARLPSPLKPPRPRRSDPTTLPHPAPPGMRALRADPRGAGGVKLSRPPSKRILVTSTQAVPCGWRSRAEQSRAEQSRAECLLPN